MPSDSFDSPPIASTSASALAPPTSSLDMAGSAPKAQPPRLKRLASKPFRLVGSAISSVSHSRAATPAAGAGPQGPILDPAGASVSAALRQATSEGAPGTVPQRPRRRLGRRRHQRISFEHADPASVARAAKGPRKPLEGEEPAAWLRVRVVSAAGLIAKDRGNTSDPFISLTLPPSNRHSTPVIKRTLDPVFPAQQSTFDFPLYLSLAGVVGGRGLEGVVWDKDLMRKEYMGELVVPVTKWFGEGPARLWADDLPTSTHPLLSTRRRHKVTGIVTLQIGMFHSSAPDPLRAVQTVYDAIVDRSGFGRGLGVLGVPAHEGIGTIQMRKRSPAAQDASLSSFQAMKASLVAPVLGQHKTVPAEPEADDDEEEDDLSDDGLSSSSDDDAIEDALEGDDDGMLRDSPHELSAEFSKPEIKPESAATTLLPPTTPARKPSPSRSSSLGYFARKPERRDTSDSVSTQATPDTSALATPGASSKRQPIFKRSRSKATRDKAKRKSTRDFNFDREAKDVLGIVVMEVSSANDLPKIKNALRTGWDMDPFVVVSFGKKVFRTRVVRHSLNPTWDEKLLFHVRRHESAFTIQLAVLDWDKISGNDFVGSALLPVAELMADAPKPAENGLYGENEDGKHESKEVTLPILTAKDQTWESRHKPTITVRAKYEPYDALRQRFWRQYIAQYDSDDTNTLSYIELSSMLDSLGSTLTQKTIEGYFASCGKTAERDELTMDEVILCLEREVNKSRSEKAHVSRSPGRTGPQTPMVGADPVAEGIDMTGPAGNIGAAVDADELAERIRDSRPREEDEKGPGNQRARDLPSFKVDRTDTAPDSDGIPVDLAGSGSYTPLSSSDADDSTPDDRERVINIKTCPLCHRPRLGKRSEQDIVTHLAICASADWSRVDRIVTGNYVTSSQAQRKFFTKIINHITVGAYSLGANSANILVQDRATGQLQEEKMAVYVRLGIRVLYKAARSQMEGGRARRLLRSLSIKQGIKYDSPASVLDIAPFIAFHNLDVTEIRDPLDSFKTFNEFFYRKLKPGARPIEEPDNPGRLVSAADCRMMAFESVTEATQIWIKGREFTVGRLLSPVYQDQLDKFEGGPLAIFRLAPQDYHRFHSPVRGTVGKMTLIDGEYYTVNPMAVRAMDIYTENVRKIVPIETEEFGTVMTVWIGAMMVGSIGTSVKEGQLVDRGDELGWFAFGGSTIVCVFERGSLEWDEDLLNNGRAAIESLVKMGSGIGRAIRPTANNANA
ncbi:phosphatidylserine decarboxylase [Cryptotrichosporon argae]